MRTSLLYLTSGLTIGLLLITIKFCSGRTMENKQLIDQVGSVDSVIHLLKTAETAIPQKIKTYIGEAEQQIDRIVAIPDDQRTFANTAKAFDNVVGLSNATIAEHIYEGLELLSPNEKIREAAHKAVLQLRDFWVEQIMNNKELYQAFKTYVERNAKNESLDVQQQYFLTESNQFFF